MEEVFFNSAMVFFITIPTIVFISALILKSFIKSKFWVLGIIFIVQVILYYGYSVVVCHMKIQEVYLDYVGYIIMNTLIFGFLGIGLSIFLKKIYIMIKNKCKDFFTFL